MSIIKLEIVHRSDKEHLKPSSPESNAASQTAGLDISADIDDHSIISEGHKDLSTKYVPMKRVEKGEEYDQVHVLYDVVPPIICWRVF